MSIPYRRCFYLDDHGQQCDKWFPADDNKLCEAHREIIGTSKVNTEESKVKYIDLVNDERQYCYHFLNGESQNQDQTLIYEFKDNKEGTVFEKLDRHIAFFEKIKADISARHQSARAVRAEKMDELTEEERKHLRTLKIEKALKPEKIKEKLPSFKQDPVGFLSKKNSMSKADATALLDLDEDELLAKFARAKLERQEKEKQ